MKTKSVFTCQQCGSIFPKWLGQCPDCGAWHSMLEELKASVDKRVERKAAESMPRKLDEIVPDTKQQRQLTGSPEIDRVLGGGLVKDAVILIGGEPGIGKSTALLQVLAKIASNENKALYISGEESPEQVAMRAQRLGIKNNNILILSETDYNAIEASITQCKAEFLAIDSIQTICCPELSGAPGTVSQVRETASRLVKLAKTKGITMFLIGHVTKDGAIAGPRVLEHLVDTVLYFEGDSSYTYRILRTIKNRFGPTHEIGLFEMAGDGLKDVANPSEFFLHDRQRPVPGSVIFPSLEGSRPILVEIQALVTRSFLANPRRTSTGFDPNRLAMLLAVIEKHLGIFFYENDVFINVSGGLKLSETAADVAVIAALLSSLKNQTIAFDTAMFGEAGLSGEVRSIARPDLRIAEAKRLGIKRIIAPNMTQKKSHRSEDIQIKGISRINGLYAAMFAQPAD